MREYLRQSIHLVFGLIIATLILYLDRDILLMGLSVAILVGFIISELIARGKRLFIISPLLDLVDRKDPIPGRGALFFVLSALVILILFPVWIAFLSILALSIVDGAATIAGRTWGRTTIVRGKTLEGTLAGMMVSFTVFLFFVTPVNAIFIALFASAIELFSPVDDNLIIPVATGVFLQLVGKFG